MQEIGEADLSYSMLSFPRFGSRVFPLPCRAGREPKEKMQRATSWAREVCAGWKDGRKGRREEGKKGRKQSPLCPPAFQHPPLSLSSVSPSGGPLTSGGGVALGRRADLAVAAASSGRAWWPAAAPRSGVTRTPGKRALTSASPARRSPSRCSAGCRRFPGTRERMRFPKPGAWGGSRSPGRRKSDGSGSSGWARGGRRKLQDFQPFIKGCKSSFRTTSYRISSWSIIFQEWLFSIKGNLKLGFEIMPSLRSSFFFIATNKW